ncbi:phosphoglycerate mutase family protein [Dysgonomonas termitidis]|uniref:Phosphoglycerate mutase family protein n=1 Tax=Dysgonomonas termitidis TaxID=1516126 RepID=A0ABV9KUS7_9BACT
MESIINIAVKNQEKAYEIIEKTGIILIWESVGAEVNLVGSLKTGLLMTNNDIDFHVYSSPLLISDSFLAMGKLAENPGIMRLEYINGIETEEQCIEWHVWYQDDDGSVWKIDVIHILKGSRYDGYFEQMAKRINEVMTPGQKETILRLKYETRGMGKIIGVEYYQAVIRDGIDNVQDFIEWREKNPVKNVVEWIP